MKITFHILLTMGLLMMIGCQTGLTKSEGISDAELIQAIIDADKTEISLEQLPAQSRMIMEHDYYDYITIDAKMASQLGYEVSMGGTGHRMGDRTDVYFNMEGRRLDPKGDGRDKDDWDRDDKDSWKCFELVLPVTFVMPDGTTIIVANREDWDQIKDWYEANPDAEEKPALQYPVDISFKDETVTINNNNEMRDAYERCGGRDDDRDRECFELVYPVTFIMPDGSTITVADIEDWAELKDWYEANPDAEERPTLQYPVDITYRDGTTQTINNDEEMRRAKEDCRDEDEDRP